MNTHRFCESEKLGVLDCPEYGVRFVDGMWMCANAPPCHRADGWLTICEHRLDVSLQALNRELSRMIVHG